MVDVPKRNPRPTTAPAALESKFLIPAKEQAARDLDRLAVLQEELKLETAAFNTKRKILEAPATNSRLGPDERGRVQEAIVRHEQNIRALNAGIARIRN
jgi:small-conductance mechanosensitive channel